MKTNVKPGKTPEKITVSMIDEDLNNGITKPEMAIKYGIKLWEVAEMFKHPFLKGRRPSKKKPLSFIFEDDTDEALMKKSTQELFDQIDELPDVDPNQIDLEDAIEESTKEIETAVNGLEDVNKAIVDMLGPTDETPEETLEKVMIEAKESMVNGAWKAEDSETEETIELDEDDQDALNEALVTLVNEDGETLKEVFDKELEKEKEEELEIDDDTFEL